MIAVLSLPCGKHHYSQAGDAVRSRLRVRAARHGRSMEEEAREILKGVLVEETWSTAAIRNRHQINDSWAAWKCPVSKRLRFKSHSTASPTAFLQTPLSKAPPPPTLEVFRPGRSR
jgi:plasmid stability protein